MSEELFDEMEMAIREVEDKVEEARHLLWMAEASTRDISGLERTWQGLRESSTLLDFVLTEMHTEADEHESQEDEYGGPGS